MRNSAKLTGLTCLALLGISMSAHADALHSYRYRVTIQNVTAANALSPFLATALKSGAALFEVGKPASQGIADVAETGDTTQLEAELAMNPYAVAVVKAPGGPVPATGSVSAEIDIPAYAVKSGATLNLVAMIGKSNDSFVAVRGLKLAALSKGSRERLSATNYDAGSEENTGNVGDFGPGGHPTASAECHISVDRGLNLRGDAPEILGWGSIAAWVTVERIQ